MIYNSKLSKNPFESTVNDLKMFEQTQYCFEHIKQTNSNKSDEEIIVHADIASACFRHANEYYKAATLVGLSTSPLLFSYAINNILKGTCYLLTFDENILSGFNNHGFQVKSKEITENILESKINIKEHGAIVSLLKIFGNSINAQKIYFNKILRHIPGISDIYFKTTGSMPLLALQNRNNVSEYIIEGDTLDEEIQKIMKDVGIVRNIISREQRCYCSINMKCKTNIEKGIYSKDNMYYQRYLVIPEKFKEGIKDINIAFYCYLLIMAYGMLVRYNAHKWECFIDRKKSKEATLIELSVTNSVMNFYYQIHYMLFKYYYEEDSYNDVDVKKVIRESTKDIMNNITKEIEHHNLQYNTHDLLPWAKNYR